MVLPVMQTAAMANRALVEAVVEHVMALLALVDQASLSCDGEVRPPHQIFRCPQIPDTELLIRPLGRCIRFPIRVVQ